jgi:predicted transcriptional regulator of viral defense system
MGRREYLDQISEVAADQGGYITAAQAARSGVPHERMPELVAAGDLRRVRNGVYATRGVSVDPLEDTIAAWLSTERERYPWERSGTTPNAVVSHRSAASIWGLGTIIPELPALTTARSARPGRGIEFHRLPVGDDDWRWWRPEGGPDLPVTTPARTIVDLLIEREEPSYIERAIREAAVGGLASETELLDAARRRRSRNRWLVETLTRMTAR